MQMQVTTWSTRMWMIMWQVVMRAVIATGRARSSAQSTVEYALVGALIVIGAAGALTILGGELTTVFTNISKTLSAAAGR